MDWLYIICIIYLHNLLVIFQFLLEGDLIHLSVLISVDYDIFNEKQASIVNWHRRKCIVYFQHVFELFHINIEIQFLNLIIICDDIENHLQGVKNRCRWHTSPIAILIDFIYFVLRFWLRTNLPELHTCILFWCTFDLSEQE